LLQITADALREQVIKNYTTIAFKYDQTDAAMLSRLVSDVWQFSAAKNYKEMKDFTNLLKDQNGNLRTFADFKTEAEKISSKYNELWMRTEYNFAVSASQNAARWNEFEKEAEIIPNLQYQTAGDNMVRYEHAILDGTVKPINDDWWNRYFPPNGWGCRCEAIQSVDGSPVTTESREIRIPKVFETNLGKQGLIYPKGHAYYKDVPREVISKSILYLPPENTYTKLKLENGSIDIHPLISKTEIEKSTRGANALLKVDPMAEIKLLPTFDDKDINTVKAKFFPGDYFKDHKTKNPDAIYNGKVIDFKEPKNAGKGGIKKAIEKGAKQTDFIIILVHKDMKLDDAVRHAMGELKHYAEKKDLTVWLMDSSGDKKELSVRQNGQ
jgi:SPP1 gp7 family putative phage head morphogenesis protein